jgi:hypothetical protein
MEKRDWIPAENLGALLAEIKKLNRRATKLGLAPIAVTVHGKEMREVRAEDFEWSGLVYKREFADVEVVGETPKLEGWRLLAVLDFSLGEKALFRWVPGEQGFDTGIGEPKPYCEHCKTKRRRKDTFLVANEANEVRQVGRNCLVDYLGGASPEAILYAERFLKTVEDGFRDEGGGWGGHSPTYIDPLTLMEWVVGIARETGYVSRKMVNEGRAGVTTGELAAEALFPTPQQRARREFREWREKVKPTDQDKAKAKLVVEWAAQVEAKFPGDWLDSISKLATAEAIFFKHVTLFASALAGYARHVEGIKRRASAERAGAERVHFGQVKERLRGIEVEVVRRPTWESDYGPVALFILKRSDREWATWRTGKLTAMDEGKRYKVDATVKEHKKDKFGNPETALTRLAVLEEVA